MAYGWLIGMTDGGKRRALVLRARDCVVVAVVVVVVVCCLLLLLLLLCYRSVVGLSLSLYLSLPCSPIPLTFFLRAFFCFAHSQICAHKSTTAASLRPTLLRDSSKRVFTTSCICTTSAPTDWCSASRGTATAIRASIGRAPPIDSARRRSLCRLHSCLPHVRMPARPKWTTLKFCCCSPPPVACGTVSQCCLPQCVCRRLLIVFFRSLHLFLPFPSRFRSPPPADTLQAPYLNFMTAGNTLNQMWYDDPQSLVVKYQLAVDKGLRGISVWHIDAVPYTTNASAADDMWVRWRQRGCDADVVALTDYSQTGHPCQVFPCQTRLITL